MGMSLSATPVCRQRHSPVAAGILPALRSTPQRSLAWPIFPASAKTSQYLYNNSQTVHQADGRLDFNRTSADRIFFRYSVLDSVNDNTTNVNQFFQNGNADSKTFDQNMQVSDLLSISPTKMNELRLAYNRSNVKTSNKTEFANWNNQFGIPNGNPPGAGSEGLAEFDMQGVPSIKAAQPLRNRIGSGYIVSNTIAVTDNYTWIKGRHALKFGTNFNYVVDVSADTIGGDNPRGALTFNEAMTSFDGVGYNGGGNASNALAVQPVGYPASCWETWFPAPALILSTAPPTRASGKMRGMRRMISRSCPRLPSTLDFATNSRRARLPRYNRESNWDTRTNQLVLATASNRSPALNLDKNDWGRA